MAIRSEILGHAERREAMSTLSVILLGVLALLAVVYGLQTPAYHRLTVCLIAAGVLAIGILSILGPICAREQEKMLDQKINLRLPDDDGAVGRQ